MLRCLHVSFVRARSLQQMTLKKLSHQLILMERLLGIYDAVAIAWIHHQIELLVCILKRMDQLKRVGHVYVVIDLAMDQH